MENQEFNNNNISTFSNTENDVDITMTTAPVSDVSVTATISGTLNRDSTTTTTTSVLSGKAGTSTTAVVTTVTSTGVSRPTSTHRLVGGGTDQSLDID